MLDELRKPAPSHIYSFIATRKRITADANLKATVGQSGGESTTVRTSSLEIQLKSDTLVLHNIANGAEWRVALGDGQGAWSHTDGYQWKRGDAQPQLMNDRLVRVTLTGSQDKTRLTVAAAEPFFGMGERFDSANQAGQYVVLQPNDFFGGHPKGRHWSYVTVPLLYDPNGMGIFADTTFISKFDIAHTGFTVETDGAPVDYYFFVEPDGKSVLSG